MLLFSPLAVDAASESFVGETSPSLAASDCKDIDASPSSGNALMVAEPGSSLSLGKRPVARALFDDSKTSMAP